MASGGREGSLGRARRAGREKQRRKARTSFNSLSFRRWTFTNVSELQHWKIFTPGMVIICKTNVKLREISQLLPWSRKSSFRTSWRIYIFLYKKQEPANSSSPLRPLLFLASLSPFSFLLASHPTKVRFRAVLWLQDCKD